MKPSEKLKSLRLSSGFGEHEIAASVGISIAEYYDLEGFDDLENAIDLGVLWKLADLLDVRLSELFSDQSPDQKMTPAELASRLGELVRGQKIELEKVEEEIGWTIGPFLKDPDVMILSWNIACLQDVCRATKSDWLFVLNSFEPR